MLYNITLLNGDECTQMKHERWSQLVALNIVWAYSLYHNSSLHSNFIRFAQMQTKRSLYYAPNRFMNEQPGRPALLVKLDTNYVSAHAKEKRARC